MLLLSARRKVGRSEFNILDLRPLLLCEYLIINLCYFGALDMLASLPMYIGCKSEGVVWTPTCLYSPFFLTFATQLPIYICTCECQYVHSPGIVVYIRTVLSLLRNDTCERPPLCKTAFISHYYVSLHMYVSPSPSPVTRDLLF
jgi:hypothetical protein